MTDITISKARFYHQHISGNRLTKAQELVAWMGAMQAQDYSMAKWALGLRLPGITGDEVEKEINSGKILRTHLLRPTWHFVSSDDIHWMLELTASHVKRILNARLKNLELSPALLKKSTTIIEKILAGGTHLTRNDIMTILAKSKIRGGDLRRAHIMMHAELDGLVCSGKSSGKEKTYALISERAPKKKNIHRDEALAMLAQRFFKSHGPATVQDFSWWSGLGITDARKGIDFVKSSFENETQDGFTYYFLSFPAKNDAASQAYLLPAYDELLIGYKNREANCLHSIAHLSLLSMAYSGLLYC
jgi:hypothetical protein